MKKKLRRHRRFGPRLITALRFSLVFSSPSLSTKPTYMCMPQPRRAPGFPGWSEEEGAAAAAAATAPATNGELISLPKAKR